MLNRKSILLFFAISSLIAIFSFCISEIVDVNFLSVLFAMIFLLASFAVNYKDYKNDKKYQFIHILFLFISLVLAIYNSIHRDLPFTGVDWYNYDFFAQKSLSASNNTLEIFGNSIDLFTACIAVLYKIFGTNITMIYFYILPFSFILSHYLYKTVFYVTNNKKKSMFMSTIILLLPVNFVFSLSVLREIPIQCMTIISLYYFLIYLVGDKKCGLFRSLLFGLLAGLMHSGMFALLLIYSYVLFQKKIFGNVKMVRISTIIFAMLFIMLMFTPIFSTLISKRFNFVGGIDSIVTSINTQNSYLLDATTNYVGNMPTNIIGLVFMLPYRLLMFVISPLPWQIRGVSTLVAFFADAIIRYYIVFRVIRTIFNLSKYTEKEQEILRTTFMVVLVFDLIFCLGTTNYGQAMRHRTKMLPFELVILSVPKTKRIARKNA